MSEADARRSFFSRIAPGLILMVLAPLVAETLQGATHPSTYVAFPPIFFSEMAVWGGGALFARYFMRKFNLGGLNLLLLALVLAVAEEFLIQQTSIAPMVLQIKGIVYARAFGVNYVYFPWALIYEAVNVVLIPVLLAELIFPTRRRESWLSTWGFVVAGLYFALGAFFAWFSWTHIARAMYHLPHYDPPLTHIIAGLAMVVLLTFLALGPLRRAIANAPKATTPPPPIVLAVLSFVFAVLAEVLVVLAFGAAPEIPPALPLGITFAVCAAAIALIPGWAAHANWRDAHRFALVFGGIAGNCLAGYLGGYVSVDSLSPLHLNVYSSSLDFWGKTVLDAIALVFLIGLGMRVGKRSA
ncbi:MAG TPA: hypothetical protein VG841_08295 [Caulobacterales bacterium]|nr:hypothetical protein [Caulobacterales bacterium]